MALAGAEGRAPPQLKQAHGQIAQLRGHWAMKVEDLRPQGAGWRVQLHEKGGKEHAMPCHHALAEALRAYIDTAGIAEDRKGWLFRTSPRHNAAVLTE